MSYKHQRYDVEAWVNSHDEIEIKVYDYNRQRVVGHLVEAENQPSTVEAGDDYFYGNVWVEDYRNWAENCTTAEVTLKKFAKVDREAPADSENTLYWELSSDKFDWHRHPLSSWESCLATDDGLVAFEALGNTHEWLTNHFNKLVETYMDNDQ